MTLLIVSLLNVCEHSISHSLCISICLLASANMAWPAAVDTQCRESMWATALPTTNPGHAADLEETLLWTLLNSGVALIGYWVAATLIDNPKVGRLRMQLIGFLAVCILFYISAAIYPSLASKKGLPTFQFIYFFSSFWGQFGPNCTTFLLAGIFLASPCHCPKKLACLHGSNSMYTVVSSSTCCLYSNRLVMFANKLHVTHRSLLTWAIMLCCMCVSRGASY